MNKDLDIFNSYFTKDECEYLLSYSNNFKPSGITINGEDVFNDYRISEDSLSTNDELKKFLLDKFSNFNIISIPRVGYIKYTKGSKFKLHRDRNDSNGLFGDRYKTLIIQLSDPKDYIGGNLIVEKNIMPTEQGSVILFNSKCLHEVTELEDGIRYSLCLFLTKNNFKSNFI
jgi:predicted 2-oxoglutarate/Fe(II)-dependent dioxygenase YbiX